MTSKNLRGRPRGTDIPADRITLATVADLIIQEPTLRPTTAIKRVVSDWTDSVVHRLLGKWRKQREGLIEAARERANAESKHKSSLASLPAIHDFASMAAQIQALQKNPALLALQKINDLPTFRLMREMQSSSLMRAVEQMRNNPLAQMARQQELFMRRWMRSLPTK